MANGADPTRYPTAATTKTILAPTASINGPVATTPNGPVRNISPTAADSTLERNAAGVRVVMTVKIGAPVRGATNPCKTSTAATPTAGRGTPSKSFGNDATTNPAATRCDVTSRRTTRQARSTTRRHTIRTTRKRL